MADKIKPTRRDRLVAARELLTESGSHSVFVHLLGV